MFFIVSMGTSSDGNKSTTPVHSNSPLVEVKKERFFKEFEQVIQSLFFSTP